MKKEAKEKSSAPVVIPRKNTVNLAMRENYQNQIMTAVIGIVGVAVIGFVFTKFGILDQQARLTNAQATYDKVHAQNESLKESTANYATVFQEYRSVTGASVSANGEVELAVIDRQDILDIVEKEIMPKATVDALQITDNTLALTLSGITLKDVSSMLKTIEAYPIVKRTSVNSAKTGEEASGSDLSDTSVTIYLQKEVTE